MSYFHLLYKSRLIDIKRREAIREKLYAIKIHHGVSPKYNLIDKIRHQFYFCGHLVRKIIFCTWVIPKRFNRYWDRIRAEETFENYLFKSVVGFLAGVLLTYIIYVFLILQLNFSLRGGTFLASCFGLVLTLGLAFSQKVRCIVMLVLPIFFSKRGRQALMGYAFVLVLSGPAKNSLRNMGVLSESMACGQEQLKTAVKQIMEFVKKPFLAIKTIIKKIVAVVKNITSKMKDILLGVKRMILSIAQFIKSAFQWLGSIINICNKKVGTPFQRCMRVMDNAILDCQAKLGPTFSWLCSVTYVAKTLCWVVKVFDFICMLLDFVTDSIIGDVYKKLNIFLRHVRTMFYVKIRFSHSFGFQSTHSKSIKAVTDEILLEIKERTQKIVAVLNIMSCAISFFFLFIIAKGMHYRFKFLTDSRYDNTFITPEMWDIDFHRAKYQKETIFPLKPRERIKYVNPSSLHLTLTEKTKLSKSLAFLTVTSMKLSTHLMADYALYWILAKIRYYARTQSPIPAPNSVGLHVEGTGILADLYKSVIKAFSPFGTQMDLDTIPCLPDPVPPDMDQYIQIATLVGLCWSLAFFEPYGLRLRNSVMRYYYPKEARIRSVWLYNHILRGRINFLKYTRRELRARHGNRQEHVTIMELLRSHTNNKCLLYFLGKDEERVCLVCSTVERKHDFIECSKPGCPGLYCTKCFTELHNLCTICKEPIEYGDLSDMEEELSSSDEEYVRRVEREYRHRHGLPSPDPSEIKTQPSQTSDPSEFETPRCIKHPPTSIDLEKQRRPDYVSVEWFSTVEDLSRKDRKIGYYRSEITSDSEETEFVASTSRKKSPPLGFSYKDRRSIAEGIASRDWGLLSSLNKGLSDSEDDMEMKPLIPEEGKIVPNPARKFSKNINLDPEKLNFWNGASIPRPATKFSIDIKPDNLRPQTDPGTSAKEGKEKAGKIVPNLARKFSKDKHSQDLDQEKSNFWNIPSIPRPSTKFSIDVKLDAPRPQTNPGTSQVKESKSMKGPYFGNLRSMVKPEPEKKSPVRESTSTWLKNYIFPEKALIDKERESLLKSYKNSTPEPGNKIEISGIRESISTKLKHAIFVKKVDKETSTEEDEESSPEELLLQQWEKIKRMKEKGVMEVTKVDKETSTEDDEDSLLEDLKMGETFKEKKEPRELWGMKPSENYDPDRTGDSESSMDSSIAVIRKRLSRQTIPKTKQVYYVQNKFKVKYEVKNEHVPENVEIPCGKLLDLSTGSESSKKLKRFRDPPSQSLESVTPRSDSTESFVIRSRSYYKSLREITRENLSKRPGRKDKSACLIL